MDEDKIELICKPEVEKIIGCAFHVNNKLGHGFLEELYQRALEITFNREDIPFVRKKNLPIYFDGTLIADHYQADVICYDKVILELKAVSAISDEHVKQLINYLKATGIQAGLVINFGNPRKLEWKKVVFTNTKYLRNNNIPTTTNKSDEIKP